MWKWLFILLLLANSLMFFWYAQQQANSQTFVNAPLPAVPTIEIVDENENVRQSNN